MQYLASCGFEPNVPEDGAGARYRTFLEITSWSIDTRTVACIYYSNKISPDIFFLEDSGLCPSANMTFFAGEEHKVARDCIGSHSTHQLCTDQHFFPPQICQHITSHPPSPPCSQQPNRTISLTSCGQHHLPRTRQRIHLHHEKGALNTRRRSIHRRGIPDIMFECLCGR